MSRITLTQIKINIRNKSHDLRNLDYFVNTEKFELALKNSNSSEYKSILNLIKTNNLLELKTVCNAIIRKDLNEKTMREIRDIARIKGIPNYTQYGKTNLLKLIKEST